MEWKKGNFIMKQGILEREGERKQTLMLTLAKKKKDGKRRR